MSLQGDIGMLCPGDGGSVSGVYFKTISVHFLKIGSRIWSFQSILLRNVLSLELISETFNPDILLHALAE